MAHFWAIGTHNSYQTRLCMINRFENAFGVRILRATPLQAPPRTPDIPLMWCQEAYSLKRGSDRRRQDDPGMNPTLAFSTLRSFRSAASQFNAWDAMISHPAQSFLDERHRLVYQTVRPTDSLSYTLHSGGFKSRLGDESRPAIPLLDRHVRYLTRMLDQRYRETNDLETRRTIALAGLANVLFSLGWLRSSEVFGLCWSDVELTLPADGPTKDLPVGVGLLGCRLQPETKSNRSHTADCVIAFQTLSGLCPGDWFLRARASNGLEDHREVHARIFRHQDGHNWTSLYFRESFLYPALRSLRAQGDPGLRPLDDSPGNALEEKFWSLHCYRRGARGHISRGSKIGGVRLRRATPDEIYEHARWRLHRSAEAIDRAYLQWTHRDRVKLTLLCM